MTKKIAKTNVARLLDQAKIVYSLHSYEVDENNLAATHVAEQLGEDISQVFKTLVLRGDRNGIFICVIPGDRELNLKIAAKISGNKSVEMIAMKQLLAISGYIRGACSPIGMKRQFPCFIDSTATNFDTIYISAGIRGLQVELSPLTLIEYIGASVEDIILVD